MRRNRMLVGVSVAVLIGLVASFIVYRQVQRMTAVPPVPKGQIVVAASNLQLGTRLTASDLRLVPWSGNVPIEGSFTRVEDCLGRALMTSVVENEMILDGKLAPKGGGAGLPTIIPEGMRAVSVPVNDVAGVAGFVVPGTMVDVLATGTSAGRGVMVTKTILEKVRVLASGQDIQQDKDGKPVKATVVTLLVTPSDADKLSMAALQGRIQLALRNTVDGTMAAPPPVEEANLFGGASEPAQPVVKHSAPAPKAAPPSVTVEMIYGSKRETKSFTEQ